MDPGSYAPECLSEVFSILCLLHNPLHRVLIKLKDLSVCRIASHDYVHYIYLCQNNHVGN